ncbi:MAG: hypothetical protein ACTHJ5_17945 [Ilyomonas sp.]
METPSLQSGSLQNTPSLDTVVNIAAGGLLLLSGLFHFRSLDSTLKTLLGGYLLFKGLSEYSEGESSYEYQPEGVLSEDTLVMITE